MATEKGVVIRVGEDTAWVKAVKTEACESCSARDTCNTLGGGKEMEVEAINGIGAGVGDKVVIGFETSSLFKLSFMVYIFPIICMIFGAVIGQETAPAYSLDPSTLSAIFGFTFFILAFFIIKIIGKSLSGKEAYRAKIIRIR